MSAELAPPAALPELEPKETEETKLEGSELDTELESESSAPTRAEPPPTSPAGRGIEEAARQNVLARIRSSSSLPPGLQTRLAELVAAGSSEREGALSIPIEDVLTAVEAGLPALLGTPRLAASRPEHPTGEGFFFGRAGELSEQEAEALARGQLARSGLLRGQRVRVAQD